jgi:hypothetical protein
MNTFKKITSILSFFLLTSLLIINGCGDKGGGTPPPTPNPCASKTITVTGTVVNTTTGLPNGSITVTAAGSTGFTYQLNTGAFQAGASFTGLAAGTYTVTAKDADGCTGSNTFTVTDPCAAKNITVTATIVNAGVGLSNGSITATATNSTGFTYQLNTGAFQASGTFTGLAVGTYNVTAKDVDGCTKTQSFTVSDICAVKTITITATIVNAGTGLSNGSIAATASGSTGFTYQLNSGAFQASGTFIGLAVGTYNITAKDVDGCLKTQSFTVNDICTAKTITVTATVTSAGPAAGATNGSIAATASGSTGFTYQLNSGAFQASGTFTSLAAATYNVTAKDVDGCLKTQSFIVTTDPCLGKTLTISAVTTGSDKCAPIGTGTITITVGGGTGFTYQLNTGTFQASNIFTGLAVNTYNIAAKDADGCIKTGTASVAAAAAGTNFTAVKAVLQTNCALSGCHSGATPTGGLNFTVDCTIVNSWDRIKARAVDAPTSMPPPPNAQLSAADKQKILDWIAAGHGFTN